MMNTVVGLLSLLSYFYSANSFATPNADFLLGIDGSSITTGHGHVCVLEQRSADGVGGRAQCWGGDHKEGATNAPKNVSSF